MANAGGSGAMRPEDGVQGVDGELEEPTDITDGRTLRRRRNRDAVIRSLVQLIREGELSPTIEKVAERAEVSPRSIFRYFDDLNDLARNALQSEMIAAVPLGIIPDAGEGDLPHRIDALVEARERLFRSIHLLFVVANRRADDIDDVRTGLEGAASMLLEQMRHQFRPELGELDPDDAEALVCTLSAALGLEAWDHQIRRLGQAEEEVVDGWRLLLGRTFA